MTARDDPRGDAATREEAALEAAVLDEAPPPRGAPAAGAGTVVRGGALLAGALAVSNGFGYALNLVASRVLGPEEFGAFAALMGIVLVANVGALALQSVTARRLATDGAAAGQLLLRLGRLAGLGIAAVLAAAAPLLTAFLHVGVLPVLLVAAGMLPLTLVGARLGLAQGAERFGSLSILYILVATGKMGGALIGLLLVDDVTAGLIGMVAGASVAAAVAMAVAAPPGSAAGGTGGGAAPERRAVAGELLIAAAALFAFFGLTNVDVLLARHHLPATEAGLYALGAVVAKGAFWFPQFIAVLAYPMLVDRARRERAIRVSVALVGASGALLTAGTALVPGLVVGAVGGSEYEDLADDVWLFALAGSLFALAQLLVYARLALGDRRAGLGVAGTAIGLVLAVQLGADGSLRAIVLALCVAAAVLCAIGLAAERAAGRDLPDGPSVVGQDGELEGTERPGG